MQIIKYSWHKLEPKLHLKGEETIKISLFGRDINMKFMDKKCIGFFDGKHNPCPDRKILEYGYNCSDCKKNDLFFRCMQCTGEECINEKRRDKCKEEEYYVYLAVFDSLIKVGISLDRRLLERLVEQGADFGAKILHVKDGKEVRLVERNIMNTLNITDRVRGNEKAERIFCNPNNAMKNLYRNIVNLKKILSEQMKNVEIFDLRTHYKLTNVTLEPDNIRIKTGLELQGTVVAAKGNIVIIKQDDRFISFNAHEMIGREIVMNGN